MAGLYPLSQFVLYQDVVGILRSRTSSMIILFSLGQSLIAVPIHHIFVGRLRSRGLLTLHSGLKEVWPSRIDLLTCHHC